MKTVSKILIAGAAVLGLGLSSLPAQAQTTVYRTTYVTRVVHHPRYYYDNYNYRTDYTTCGCDTCGGCCTTCNYCNTCDTCNTCGYRSHSWWPFW